MIKPEFPVLETKYNALSVETTGADSGEISGYASLFGTADQSGDVVKKGAYATCLKKMIADGQAPKMLWQHDPTKPIGVWEDIREDDRGLFVKGRILPEIQAGTEALALIKAGAIDGLSIGYRTLRAEKKAAGGRLLHELELWEVSLVTFPMLPEARVEPTEDASLAHDLVDVISDARNALLA